MNANKAMLILLAGNVDAYANYSDPHPEASGF